MKERSITSRNLWGGFLGGLLGILCFGLINEYLLIVGCLVGVVGGYCYQEIWQVICDSWVETKTAWQEMYTNTIETLQLIASDSAKFLKRYEMDMDFYKFLKYIIIPLMHFLDIRNSTIIKWLKAHPMNRAYTIRGLAGITVTALHLLWLIPFWQYWKADFDSPDQGIAKLLTFMVLGCLVIVGPIAAFAEEKTTTDMRNFYQQFERYSHKGAIYYYLYDIAGIASAQIFIILLGLGLLGYGLLAGVVVSTVIFLPVIAFLLIIKGIYQIALRPNHWLCLGVTLVVTTTMALATKPYLENTIMLWLVALTTGCLSGLVTEGVRRVIAWDFAKNPRITNYALATVTDQLTPTGKGFVRSFEWVERQLEKGLSPLRFNI